MTTNSQCEGSKSFSDEQLLRISRILAHLGSRVKGYRSFEGLEQDVLKVVFDHYGGEIQSVESHLQSLIRYASSASELISESRKNALSRVKWQVSGPCWILPHAQMSAIRSWIDQVFRNFLAHSLDDSRQRGEEFITFSLKWSVADSGHLILEVEDSGRGIFLPELSQSWSAQQKREWLDMTVFSPGHSTALSPGVWAGNGLGMSFLRSEAKRLGGSAELILSPSVLESTVDRVPFRFRMSFIPAHFIAWATHSEEGGRGAVSSGQDQRIPVLKWQVDGLSGDLPKRSHFGSACPFLFLPISTPSGALEWGALWGDPPVLLKAVLPSSQEEGATVTYTPVVSAPQMSL